MWLLLKTAESGTLSQPRCHPRQQQLFRVGKQLSTLWGYVLFCVTQSPPFLMPPSPWGWMPIADYKYLLWCFSESGEMLFWNPVTIKRRIIFKWEGSGTPYTRPVSFTYLYYLLAPVSVEFATLSELNPGLYVQGTSLLLFSEFLAICIKHCINGYKWLSGYIVSCSTFIVILRLHFWNCFRHYLLPPRYAFFFIWETPTCSS